jgi:protein transport protein SEC61 subunit gamma and related proteins
MIILKARHEMVKKMSIKDFVKECGRVLKVTKKPNMKDYQTVVKISAIGIAVIGGIGFLIHIVKALLQTLF